MACPQNPEFGITLSLDQTGSYDIFIRGKQWLWMDKVKCIDWTNTLNMAQINSSIMQRKESWTWSF